MRSNRQRRERRPARLFGQRNIATQPIAAARQLETVSVFDALLLRFGIIDRDTVLTKHAAYAEFARLQRDPVVQRVREELWNAGELRKGSGLFSSVAETEQCLLQMSEDQLLRLRARLVLNDFRLTAEDKEKANEQR